MGDDDKKKKGSLRKGFAKGFGKLVENVTGSEALGKGEKRNQERKC